MSGAAALAADLRRAADPVALAESIGIVPDPWQREVLRSASRRILLNCCRQSGKTTTAALLAVHTAVYAPGSLTLVLSASERQARELVRAAVHAYRILDRRPVESESENRLSLELKNGSRIIAIPASASTTRGYPGTKLLIVDEAAQIEDDVFLAIQPSLAVSGGRLILMSTPFGRRGFFHHAWKERHRWTYVEVSANECKRVDAQVIDEARRFKGEWWVRQEYFCSFESSETQAFDTVDVDRAFKSELKTWDVLSDAWS